MVVLSTHADIDLPGHRVLQLDEFTPVAHDDAFDDDDEPEGADVTEDGEQAA